MTHSVKQFFATASNPERLRVIVRMDDDDETRDQFALKDHPQVRVIVGPRYGGYGSVQKFLTEADEASEGLWSFNCDDDAWLVGNGWDDQLAKLPLEGWIAKPDRYHLGPSYYGIGSCGPEAPIWPRCAWKKWGATEIGGCASMWLTQLFTEHGWQIKLLDGITYRHDWHPDAMARAAGK